jgi:glycosyltransferase involved in cell wall biosynthesis
MTIDKEITLSILMPCLNEARTLGTCIAKAKRFLARQNFAGEIVVADNGSTDGSQEIAESLGARVVLVSERGYGNALKAGIKAARGKYMIMGDSDDSYDFESLEASSNNSKPDMISCAATASPVASRTGPCRRCIAISAIRC